MKKKNINKKFFFNRCFDKNRLKKLINWSLLVFGEKKTIDLIESLKKIGFVYATKAGISLSIEDLKTSKIKKKLLFEAELKLEYINQDSEKGYLTSIEYFSNVIDTWNITNERLKKEVISNLRKKDILNPVYMMAFSGARGNISQVRQLVGMRGLMSDPMGQIIDFPIKNNFREGLTLTEYVISCYGARKGVVDTALRTATSGYLTRRLVDVAQHVIVRIHNCGTKKGIYLSELKKEEKTFLTLINRLIGRVLVHDVYDAIENTQKLGTKNQEISLNLAKNLIQNKQLILIRSPLTCQDKNYVCQLCYGWNLSTCRLVSLGESVGIIAAQSIGEPGTQLTMRTFHTGGVFSGQLLDQIKSPFSGFIFFNKTIAGQLVRTTHGQIAFLTKQDSVINLINNNHKLIKQKLIKIFKIPAYSLLFIKQNQKVKKNQILAESAKVFTNLIQNNQIYQTLYSQISGEVRFVKKKSILNFQFYSFSSNSEAFWILSAQKQLIFKKINLMINNGDFVNKNNFIFFYYYYLLFTKIAFINIKLVTVIKQQRKLIKKNSKFFYFYQLKNFITLLIYSKKLLKTRFNNFLLNFYFKYFIFEFFEYKNLFKLNQVIKLSKILKKKIFFFKRIYNIKIVNIYFYKFYFKFTKISFLLKKNQIFNEFKILLKTLLNANFFIKKQIQNNFNYFLNKRNIFKNKIKKYKKNLSFKNQYLKFLKINKILKIYYRLFQLDLNIFLIKNNNLIHYIFIIKTQKVVNFLIYKIFKKILLTNKQLKFFLTIQFLYLFKKNQILFFLNRQKINYVKSVFVKKLFKIKNLFFTKTFLILKRNLYTKKKVCMKKIDFRFYLKKNINYVKKIYYSFLNNKRFNSFLLKKFNRCLIFSVELFLKNFDYYKLFSYFNNNQIRKNLSFFFFTKKKSHYKLNFLLTKQLIQIYLILYLKTKTFLKKKLKFKKSNFFLWIYFLNQFLKYISFLKKLSKINQITLNSKFKEINHYTLFKKLYFFTICIFNNKKLFITNYQIFLNNLAIYLNLFSQLKSKILIDYFSFLFKKSKKNIFKLLLFNYNQELFIKNFDFMYFKSNFNNFKFNIHIWNLKKKIISSIFLKNNLHKYIIMYNFKVNQKILLTKPFSFTGIAIIKIPVKLNIFLLIINNKKYWFNKILKIKIQKISKNKIILKSYFIFNYVEIIKNNFLKYLKKFKIYLSFFKYSLIINNFSKLITNLNKILLKNSPLIIKFYLKLKKYFLIKLITTNNNYIYLNKKFKIDFNYYFKNQKVKNLILLHKILIFFYIDYFLKNNNYILTGNCKNNNTKLKEKQLVILIFKNSNLNFKINFRCIQNKISFLDYSYNILNNPTTWFFIINKLSTDLVIHNIIISIGYYQINNIIFEQFILFNKMISIYFKTFFYINKIFNIWYFKIKNFLNLINSNKFILVKLINHRFIASKLIFFNNYINYKFFFKINNSVLKTYNYFYFEFISIKIKRYCLNNYFFTSKNKTHYKTNFCNLLIFTRQKKFKIIHNYYRLIFFKKINLQKFNLNLKKKKFKFFIKIKKNLLQFFFIRSSKIILNDYERYNPKLMIQKMLFNLSFQRKNSNKKLIFYNKLMQKKYMKNFINYMFLVTQIKFIIKNFSSNYINSDLTNLKIIYSKKIFLINIKKNFHIKNKKFILTNYNFKKPKIITTKLILIKNLVNNKVFFFNDNKKFNSKKVLLSIPITLFKNTNYFVKNFFLNLNMNNLVKNNVYYYLQYKYFSQDFVKLIHLFYNNNTLYYFFLTSFNLRNKIYYFNMNKQNRLIKNIFKKIFINKNFFYYLTVSNYYKTLKQFTKGFSKYKGEILKIVPATDNFKTLKYVKSKKINLITVYYLTNKNIKTYKLNSNVYNLVKKSLGSFLTYGTEIISNIGIFESGQLLLINKKKIILRKAKCFSLASGGICDLQNFSFVNINSPLLTLTYKNLKTEDIVQGIPKIDQIFEARENLIEQSSLNNLIKLNFIYFKKFYNHQIAVRKSIEYIQQYIVNGIQDVYQSQGVTISDKHIEIIVKQMTSKVKIIKAGNTNLLRGDIVYLNWIEQINKSLIGQKVKYEPLVLGISKSSLEIEGFISAASFQETVKILSRAAILQKQDFLCGLKENLILGQLLPTGTGFEFPVIFLKKSIKFFKNIKKNNSFNN